MERIYKYIEKYGLLNMNDTVLAAVSGGADSMLLLRALVDLRSQYKLNLAVIHINHSLRGEDAVADADFVAQMCAAWQVPCRVVTKDVAEYAKEQHLSEEAAGHEVRYQAFQEEMACLNADKLALGHHLNDRAESVMMHILKGCSPAGLAVLAAKQGKIIRPLLGLSKEEILQICTAENIPYCTDSTNFETICLRNKLRMELLPILRNEYNPHLDRALCQLAEMAAEDENYFNEQTKACLIACAVKNEQSAEIDLALWRCYHATLKRRTLQSLWQSLSGRQKLSFAQIEQILKLAREDCGEKKLSLPYDWQIVKRYDKLFLQKEQMSNGEDYVQLWRWQEGELALLAGVLKCSLADEMETETTAYQEFVDADKLDVTLEVRKRRAGDRMRPLGTGEKKVKDILIDKKIPRDLRDNLPLVVCNGKIVWLAGVALSDEFKVTAETKRIARLTFERTK